MKLNCTQFLVPHWQCIRSFVFYIQMSILNVNQLKFWKGSAALRSMHLLLYWKRYTCVSIITKGQLFKTIPLLWIQVWTSIRSYLPAYFYTGNHPKAQIAQKASTSPSTGVSYVWCAVWDLIPRHPSLLHCCVLCFPLGGRSWKLSHLWKFVQMLQWCKTCRIQQNWWTVTMAIRGLEQSDTFWGCVY